MAVVGVVVPSPVVEQSIHHCTGLMVVGSQWHNTDFLNTQTATDPTCFTTLWWHSPCPRRAATCPGPGSWRPWPGRRWTRGPASWWSRMGLTSVLRCIAVALGHWCDHYETVYNTDWDQESTGTDTGHAMPACLWPQSSSTANIATTPTIWQQRCALLPFLHLYYCNFN